MAKKQEIEKQEKEEVTVPDGVERIHNRKVYVPKADIYETEKDLVLALDVPGVDESGVDIMLEKNILNIKARVEWERPEGFSLSYSEYAVGDFERAFTISDEIDRDRISATVKNGVLTITLPKAAPAEKKIAVKAR